MAIRTKTILFRVLLHEYNNIIQYNTQNNYDFSLNNNIGPFYFAWPHVSSGSDGLFLLSPLSDMSPATSDCLEPYFSGVFSFLFQLSLVC